MEGVCYKSKYILRDVLKGVSLRMTQREEHEIEILGGSLTMPLNGRIQIEMTELIAIHTHIVDGVECTLTRLIELHETLLGGLLVVLARGIHCQPTHVHGDLAMCDRQLELHLVDGVVGSVGHLEHEVPTLTVGHVGILLHRLSQWGVRLVALHQQPIFGLLGARLTIHRDDVSAHKKVSPRLGALFRLVHEV